MIDLIAKKLVSGDIYVVEANMHLKRHEWGMAYRSIVRALSRGNLSEVDMAYDLYDKICECLDFRPRATDLRSCKVNSPQITI